MKYVTLFSPAAERQLRKLPPFIRQRIEPAIAALADNPRPDGCKKLKDYKNSYRIRVGEYRILYSVEDKILTVEVFRVGNRRDVYE